MSWNTQIGEGRDQRNSRRRGMGRIGGTDEKELRWSGVTSVFISGKFSHINSKSPLPQHKQFPRSSSTVEAN